MKLDTFEDLDCYRLAREFRKEIAKWATALPKSEDYRLKDQVLRAARSVTANLAEGFGRQHPQENLQFCRQARGSFMECLDHLNAAFDEGLISDADYRSLREHWGRVRLKLSGYISYLETLAPKDKRFK